MATLAPRRGQCAHEKTALTGERRSSISGLPAAERVGFPTQRHAHREFIMNLVVRTLLLAALAGSALAAEEGRPFLGVTLGTDEAEPQFQSVVNGGPAAKAGLKDGDLVIAIDGEKI